MSVTIKTVSSAKDFKTFARFANRLYKGNKYYVPSMPMDDLSTFSKEKNAAFEFSDAEFYLAYKDGEVVGRVAAIINHKANEAWKVKQVRFGWIDFIDDMEVSAALLDAVIEFGRKAGMTQIVGPLGFTDFDPEGMLVDGYDRLGTMALIYNHPYYPEHMKKHGYYKETGWLEYRITIPETVSERHKQIAESVMERYGLTIKKKTRRQIKKERYGQKLFKLINETYCVLYGYSLLSEKQIDQYVGLYLSLIDTEMLTFVENAEGELIAAGISIPSLSEALQKCNGEIFPFGWWHVLRALKFQKTEGVDLILMGVLPEYRPKGANALIIADLIPWCQKYGYKWGESQVEMETNEGVQSQWGALDPIHHKRRRCFKKVIKD